MDELNRPSPLEVLDRLVVWLQGLSVPTKPILAGFLSGLSFCELTIISQLMLRGEQQGLKWERAHKGFLRQLGAPMEHSGLWLQVTGFILALADLLFTFWTLLSHWSLEEAARRWHKAQSPPWESSLSSFCRSSVQKEQLRLSLKQLHCQRLNRTPSEQREIHFFISLALMLRLKGGRLMFSLQPQGWTTWKRVFFRRKKKTVDANSAVWIFTSVRELDK